MAVVLLHSYRHPEHELAIRDALERAAPNLHVSLSMTNGRWAETFHPVYSKGLKGSPLAIDKEGYKHLPSGPGLGVELDWDWIDNNTQRTLTSPSK